jgi:hypothetical protein
VNGYLHHELLHHPGLKADELYDYYLDFGPDPFIIGGGFSAWEYAKKRYDKICNSWLYPLYTEWLIREKKQKDLDSKRRLRRWNRKKTRMKRRSEKKADSK